ncbi:MAG: ATP-binding protein [Candidatus Delongbacteria bacterium]
MKQNYNRVKHILIVINSLMAILFGLVYGVRTMAGGYTLLCVADLSMAALFTVVLIWSLKHPESKMQYFTAVTFMCIFFIYMFASGGISNTGYLWSLIIPLCSIFMLDWRYGMYYSVAYFLMMTAAVCIDFWGLAELNLPDQETLGRLFTIYIISGIVAVAYEFNKRKIEADLMTARNKADSASMAKSEFLAVMSHEIRTPLHGVLGSTDLLLGTELDPVQKEYAEIANVSGKILLGVLDDILDFSKIEAGKLELELIETDIVELVKKTAKMISYQIEGKNIKLDLDIDRSLPRAVIIDPIRLRQILVNLLNNAVKFTEKGEILVKVSFTSLENGMGSFKFSVRDTGIGISEEQKTRLFKAFSQADSSITRKYGGTGLGLMIAKLLVEKMGGKICLESELGKGAEFYFTIETRYK